MSSPALSLRLGRSVVPPLQAVASAGGASAAARFVPLPAEADAVFRRLRHSNTGAIKSLSFRDSPGQA
jgi:hypothetical protein